MGATIRFAAATRGHMTDGWADAEAAGELIARARERLGKSQYALAEALRGACGRGDGIPDRTMVALWETGRRIPTPYWRTHLAAVLQLPPSVLDLAQLRHRDSEPGQAGQQSPGQDRAVTAKVARQSQEPRGGAQAITLRRTARDPPVPRTGRSAVSVRCVLQRRVVQRVRCDIECRGRRPGRIGGRSRIVPGAAPDLFRGDCGLPPRVSVQQLALRVPVHRRGASWRPALLAPLTPQLRQGHLGG